MNQPTEDWNSSIITFLGTQATMTQAMASYVAADGGLALWPPAGRLPGLLPPAFRALEGALRLQGGGPATAAAGFPAEGGQRWRPHGTGTRSGRGWTDLLILWPQGFRVQRFVVECKAPRRSLARTIDEGMWQTAGYMDRCGAEAGHLVIFDRENGWWEDRLFRRPATVDGVTIGCGARRRSSSAGGLGGSTPGWRRDTSVGWGNGPGCLANRMEPSVPPAAGRAGPAVAPGPAQRSVPRPWIFSSSNPGPPSSLQISHHDCMRSFNTAGPVVPEDHYCVRPLDRMDLDYVLRLIQAKKYFILHAPRQTGKTSALLALQDLLNEEATGPYRCVYLNFERAQTAREDVARAMEAILTELALRARLALNDDFVRRNWRDCLAAAGPDSALTEVLTEWSLAEERPLVLLIDEIDALLGDSLLSVLRQLRSGYDRRPASFPQAIVLCGVRDLRDYRIHSASRGEPVTGGSAFNISADSLRLGDFSRAEVEALLAQHTAETGQAFRPEALERIWTQTQGQPWLVNALCDRACFRSDRGRDRARPIEEDAILEAQEQLILRRVVHLDQLADKLREERVRRVIEPLLSGEEQPASQATDLERLRDLQYARDLGLLALDDPPRLANPIYREIVPRELSAATQGDLPLQPARYIDAERGLDLELLLADFQDFFRLHSQHWLKRFDYAEAGPQLLLQAFLQRVVKGGGRVEREYALGRGRTDLLIHWPRPGRPQRFVVECKILRGNLETEIGKGLAQTAGYMDACAAEAGHLLFFDRAKQRWKDKTFRRRETFDGAAIEVWGM